ncbi:AP2 domain-containing protein [Enterococcus avium]|uniref:AP2 domain-containing protein n=1 Tax=Enterococcus avium TaxID=33945 RepID=UPI00232F2AE2|nr:AP2 domain-containing protein [Enterococcus avium]MDB1728771.1 AP2 domain-containing protein [Enterococcus avium]MDB1732860.1 AP2 domain-containing protein [Enterococcus avium]
MSGKKRDYSGMNFGNLKIIGDTGKTTNRGQQIVIARHTDGRVIENRIDRIIRGEVTGNTSTLDWEKIKISRILRLINIPSRNNRSGITGVSYKKRDKVWEANINFQGKRIYLGQFKNKQDAINARKAAEEKYFKPILEKYENKKEND